MDEDKHEEAAARLEKIKHLDPENPAIFYNLGVVYSFLRKEDQAIANFERAIQLQPHYWAAWYNIGQLCLLEKEDFSRALHCFDRALAIVPDYVSAYHQKGVAYELLGDTAKAVEWWEKTLMLDPDNKQAMENIQRVTGRSPRRSDSVPK
jgi:tetratricopeptide (TPR) repeat protein